MPRIQPAGGFTLIELMIVIAIIAIIAAIAIPNLLESRITAAESSAATSLRSGIFPGQELFRTSAHNDIDGDANGEYGHLCHLSGTRSCWGYPVGGVAGTASGNLQLLSEEYDGTDPARLQPCVTDEVIQGYVFATFLDADSSIDPFADDVSRRRAYNAELYYCAVTVPFRYNDSGRRSFVLTNAGQVLTASGSELYENDPSAVLQSATNGIGAYDSIESAVTRSSRNSYWKPY